MIRKFSLMSAGQRKKAEESKRKPMAEINNEINGDKWPLIRSLEA